MPPPVIAAGTADGPQENGTAGPAYSADVERAILDHVAVERHARTAGDGDRAARAVRDLAKHIADAAAEGDRPLIRQPAVEVEGGVLGGDHARAGVRERSDGFELRLRSAGAEELDEPGVIRVDAILEIERLPGRGPHVAGGCVHEVASDLPTADERAAVGQIGDIEAAAGVRKPSLPPR